jgi:hypothetical protein
LWFFGILCPKFDNKLSQKLTPKSHLTEFAALISFAI